MEKEIIISEKDKEYIEKTKGNFVARGIHDHLNVLRSKFGEEAVKKIAEEVRKHGYEIDILKIKETEKVPTSFYMAFLVIEKQLFELDDKQIKELGEGAAKISFLLRFASRLLVSLEMLRNNANIAWEKYYKDGGELRIVEIDKENKKIIGEIHGFVGHPIHCKYLEGYFSQIIFLLLARKPTVMRKNVFLKETMFTVL